MVELLCKKLIKNDFNNFSIIIGINIFLGLQLIKQ